MSAKLVLVLGEIVWKIVETKPDIEAIGSGAELRRWYWRKDELIAQARRVGVKTTGGKFLILDRIAHFLDTGERRYSGDKSSKASSEFDWSKEPLTRDTLITDSYKNNQNVRAFFKKEVGESFKFNIALMEWIKANVGATLGEACNAYLDQKKNVGKSGFKTAIKDHNQFNQYTRDFLEDNPDMDMDDVRRFWALKIQRPSETGRHRYERSDLEMKPSG